MYCTSAHWNIGRSHRIAGAGMELGVGTFFVNSSVCYFGQRMQNGLGSVELIRINSYTESTSKGELHKFIMK